MWAPSQLGQHQSGWLGGVHGPHLCLQRGILCPGRCQSRHIAQALNLHKRTTTTTRSYHMYLELTLRGSCLAGLLQINTQEGCGLSCNGQCPPGSRIRLFKWKRHFSLQQACTCVFYPCILVNIKIKGIYVPKTLGRCRFTRVVKNGLTLLGTRHLQRERGPNFNYGL